MSIPSNLTNDGNFHLIETRTLGVPVTRARKERIDSVLAGVVRRGGLDWKRQDNHSQETIRRHTLRRNKMTWLSLIYANIDWSEKFYQKPTFPLLLYCCVFLFGVL